MNVTWDLWPERSCSYISWWTFPLSLELQALLTEVGLDLRSYHVGEEAQKLASCIQAGSEREGPRRWWAKPSQLLLPNSSVRSVPLCIRGVSWELLRTSSVLCSLEIEWRFPPPAGNRRSSKYPPHSCYPLSKPHRRSLGCTLEVVSLLNKWGRALPFLPAPHRCTLTPSSLFKSLAKSLVVLLNNKTKRFPSQRIVYLCVLGSWIC